MKEVYELSAREKGRHRGMLITGPLPLTLAPVWVFILTRDFCTAKEQSSS